MNWGFAFAVRNGRKVVSTASFPVLLVTLFTFGLVAAGCAGSSSSQGGALELVPDDAYALELWDMESVLVGDAPDGLEDSFETAWEEKLETIGVFIDDVGTIAQAGVRGGVMAVVDGQLDLEAVVDELDDAGYRDDEYQGYEIWEGESGFADAVGVIEDHGQLVIGPVDAVKAVLKSLNRDSGFLLDDDDNDMRRVLEKVDHGWFVLVQAGCGRSDIRGCEAMGASVSGGDGDYGVKMEYGFLFRNERTADSEMEEVEEYLEGRKDRSVDIDDVLLEGEFVIVTMSADEDDFDLNWLR